MKLFSFMGATIFFVIINGLIDRKRIKGRQNMREILRLAAPVILEMILGMVVWIADTAMVGRLDAQALSAVGLGGQIFFSFVNVFAALGVGAAAIVARHIGAENYERGKQSAAHAFQISIVLGMVLTIFSIFIFDKFFILAKAESKVIDLGTRYLRLIAVSGLFMVPGMVTSAILRASGDTKTPMIGAIITNVINLIGDYVLIFGKWGFPRLEVDGAAIATAIGQIIGFCYVIWVLFKRDGKIKYEMAYLKTWDKKDFDQIWHLSLPAQTHELLSSGGRLIYAFMIMQLGTLSFASNQIATTAESLSFMPNSGFAVAATTMVGQYLGAGKLKEAEENGWMSSYLAAAVMGATAIIFFFFPRQLARLFTDEMDIVDLAGKCIRIAALEQIPMGFSMVLGGALRGAGDTKGPMLTAILSTWIYRLPVTYVIVYIIKAPITALWYVTAIQYIIEAIFLVIRFKRGKWSNISIY
jgi:multidrug resistance protein, MATE family